MKKFNWEYPEIDVGVLFDISAGICSPPTVDWEGAMPGSRWNRRETNVAQAGYFTVLRSTGWFSTLRLPGGFRYLIKGPPTPPWLEKLGGAKVTPEDQRRASQAEVSLDFGMQKSDRHWVRMALMAMAGLAATLFLLWWFWHIGVRGAGVFQ